MPDWAEIVKTGANRELPPTQVDWWSTRCAAILRKVYRNGPVGVTHLAQDFGGKKNYGSKPNRPVAGSRHIIRTALQQLEGAGLVEKVETRIVEGRMVKMMFSFTQEEKSLQQDKHLSIILHIRYET